MVVHRLRVVLFIVLCGSFLMTSCGYLIEDEVIIDSEPPGIPQAFSVESDRDSLLFSWQANDDHTVGYELFHKPVGQKEFERPIDLGQTTTYRVYTLASDVPYSFRIRSYDESNNYSLPSVELIAIPPIDVWAPDLPSNFRLKVNDSSVSPNITLTWENPSNPDFEGVLIVRKKDSEPTSRTDGEEVYRDGGESFVDKIIESGVFYYYAIFSYDEVPNYTEISASINVRAGIVHY